MKFSLVGVAALVLLPFCLLVLCENQSIAGSATTSVSPAEMTNYNMLYAVNNNAFDFNDAYTVDNSLLPSFTTGSFTRVGYYVELGASWAWVSMDVFNTNPAMVGVPRAGTGILQPGTLVTNLHVESNNPNVNVGNFNYGVIEFWASNYNQNGGGLYGSNNSFFDWRDGGGGTGGGHGSFQAFSLNDAQTIGNTIFGVTASGGAGIGNQNAVGTGDTDWTFGSGTGTYATRNLEIWVLQVPPTTPGTALFWDGDVGGNWATNNWLNNVPGTGANTGTYPQNIANTVNPANITEGSVIVNSNQQAYSLTMDTGTNGAGGRPGNGSLTITNSSTLLIDTNALISNTSSVNIHTGSKLDVNGTLTINAGTTFNISGIAETATLAGTGTATLNAGGKLSAVSGSIAAITLTGAAEVETFGSVSVGTLTAPGAFLTKSGVGTLSVTNGTALVSPATYNVTAGALNFAGAVTGTGGITKTGAGTLVLANNGNSYSGLTDIVGGIVQVTASNGLGGVSAGNTTVGTGGQLQLGGAGNIAIPANEAISINGAFNGGAIYNLSNDNQILSAITLAGGSTIRVDNNSLQLRGGVALGANQLLVEVDGGTTLEINNTPITGSGTLRKQGDGALNIRVANPGFSGQTVVNNGYVDVNVANGLGSGLVTAENDGTLRISNGITLANNIVMTTDGEGTDGAIRNESGANFITGTVTANATNYNRIHVQAGQLNLTNTVTANAGIQVFGAGRLNATGTLTGAGGVSVNSGATLAAGVANFNNLGGVTVFSGATLETNGAGTATGNAISLHGSGVAGVGTLNHLGGVATINKQINANSATINNNGGQLTLSNLKVSHVGNVTFGGTGDIVVTNGFGNGSTASRMANALSHYGYHVAADGNLDLNLNAGLMGGGNPSAGPSFNALTTLITGPGNRGLDFDSDADFTATGAVTIGDNFSNLFVGIFTPDVSGTWGLRNASDDDRAGIWIDLNQNGVFNSSTAGLGTNRGEQLSWEDGGNKTFSVVAGQQYLVAFTHLEFTGGSNVDFRFTRPGGLEFDVQPGSGNQSGLWTTFHNVTPNDGVVKNGSSTLTLSGNNSYNGITSLNQGTVVAAHSNALGGADGTVATGTVVSNGTTLAIGGPAASGPVNIGNEHLTLGPTATIRNAGGNNRIGSQTIAPQNVVSAVSDTITIDSGALGDRLTVGTAGGSFNLGYSALRQTGAGDVTIDSNLTAVAIGSSLITPRVGIHERLFDRQAVAGADPRTNIQGYRTAALSGNSVEGNLTTHLNYFDDAAFDARAAVLGSAAWNPDSGPGGEHFTAMWVTSFTPTESGAWGFRTGRIDDNASFWIDTTGTLGVFDATTDRFYDTPCCPDPTSGDRFTPTLNAGTTYLLGFVVQDTGGGGAFRDMEFKAPSSSTWLDLNPSATGTMFTNGTTSTFAPTTYHLVKDNDGILRLNGLLQYNGSTQVNDGTIIVNANNAAGGTPQGNWEINSDGVNQHAVLGGNGTINLALNAQVIVSATPGIISPGDALFVNPSTTWTGDPTYSAGLHADTATRALTRPNGALSVTQAAGSTLPAIDLNGILQIDVVDPATYDVLQAIDGQIALDPNTSILNINGATDQAGWAAIDWEGKGFVGGELLDILVAEDGFQGNFSNLAGNITFLDDAEEFYVTFGQDGNSVFISLLAVPEPATWALWTLLGLVGAITAWRRKK